MLGFFRGKGVEIDVDKEQVLGEEIVRAVKFTQVSDNKADNDLKSTFHYKIDPKAGLEKGNEESDTLCKIEISHKNPIDYKNWHEEIVVLDLVCDLLELSLENKEHWSKDQSELFEKYISYVSPISENEYFCAERNLPMKREDYINQIKGMINNLENIVDKEAEMLFREQVKFKKQNASAELKEAEKVYDQLDEVLCLKIVKSYLPKTVSLFNNIEITGKGITSPHWFSINYCFNNQHSKRLSIDVPVTTVKEMLGY